MGRQLRRILKKLPSVIYGNKAYRAHMRQRPKGEPRHRWAAVWLAAQVHLTPPVHVVGDSAIARAARTRPSAKNTDVVGDAFLQSYEWRALRMRVLVRCGAECQCCGATAKDGVRIHVDHIKPRRFFPELALDEANLQVLCEVCNHGKGNWDETDWRDERNAPLRIVK